MKWLLIRMTGLLAIFISFIALPTYALGLIEAETFTTQSGIQTESTTDQGGGLNIGWIDNNDFVEYAIDVPAAGSYKLEFRVASASAGGSLQVLTKGAQIAFFSVTGTGGWQNWTTISANVSLTAGAQTLRLNFWGSNPGLFNINWLKFTALNVSSSSASLAPSTNHIEAENFNTQSGIQTESTTDFGGGLNIGWIDNGDFVAYNISVPQAGMYKMDFRVASNTAGGNLSINSNSQSVGAINVPGTGGWQNWITVSTNVNLPAGAQVLRLSFSGGNALFNINWINYALISASSSSVSSVTSSVATTELTEANAVDWGSFADVDHAITSVSNITDNVKVGASAIKFTTASGFDTGVKYPKNATAHLNLTNKNLLRFWLYADNKNPAGFQGNQPIVELITATGTVKYTAMNALNNLVWKKYNLPLNVDDAMWAKTIEGNPNLADVNQIVLHFDTWDAGFDMTIDGFEFINWTGNPPPSGPTPPAGVNATQITSKVLLYVYDPIVANTGKRLHEQYGWGDPVALAQQAASDLYESSHHLAKIEFTEIKIANEYPVFEDGHRFTDAEFAQTVSTRTAYPFMFSYKRFVEDNQIVPRVESGDIDEVWVYSMPWGGMWESTMVGDGAYWLNSSPVQNVHSNRLFAIMGLNYERGVAEAIHSYGHRSESIMQFIYGSWDGSGANSIGGGVSHNWDKFTRLNKDMPGLGGVGNVHYPVNALNDYEYSNTTLVTSNVDDWLNYPNFVGVTRSVNRTAWARADGDDQRGYLNWWYNYIPHAAEKGPDNFLNNWWRYLVDIDQFKSNQGNLKYTTGLPTVLLAAPLDGATVSGVVTLKANATADGALGRVDFYLDGNYYATDSLAPFTSVWNTVGLSGSHLITAKAYELQKGTEAVSQSVRVVVTP